MDQVVKTDIKIGDIHNGDYVSWSLYNGQKCIRKPRPADIERAFKAFLLKLEEEGFLFMPGCVDILYDNDNEHYVAITEHKEMKEESEVHLYFQRCGALLFFAYLFSSSDLHRENIIANGSDPIIVDFETLLTGDDSRDFDFEYPVMLSDSVWSSYLLPRWVRFKAHDIDASGLTGHINKDSFELNSNIPFLNGQPLYAWDYEDHIIEGFVYAYDFFIKRKDKAAVWLDLFQNCTFRVILRKTDIYANLIKLLEDHPIEKRELGANLLLRRAYENDVDTGRLDRMKKVLAEEINAVSHGEVPLFYVEADSKSIGSRGQVLCENYYLRSPIERAKWKLEQLSSINRDGQVEIISQLLSAARPLTKKYKQYQKSAGADVSFKQSIKMTSARISKITSACSSVFTKLEEKRIDGMPDGWLYLNREFNGPVRLTGIGMGLYHGVTGILCFYAALFSKQCH